MGIDVVTRRGDYLEVLLDDARTKPELEEDLGVSRSTVNRALGELAEAGLVEDRRGTCRLTLAGRLAAESIRNLREQSEGVMAATELFDGLDPELDVGLEMVTGATVRPARGARPYRAFHVFERLIEEASSIRGSARTFANPRGRELFEDAIVARGVPVEFYLDEVLFEEIYDNFADAFDRWVESGAFSGFVAPDCPRYTTVVSELPEGRHAGIALYSCDGEFHGVLINDRPEAVEWAADRLDQVAARATPLSEVL